MIKQVFDIENDIVFLEENHYAYKLLSNINAYGTSYDFCRFFKAITGEKAQAVISLFNSSMVIATVKGFYCDDEICEDIITFILMNKPDTIEGNAVLLKKIFNRLEDIYTHHKRAYYRFTASGQSKDIVVDESPKLDVVYEILSEGFKSIRDNYQLWMTDTSHRIRRSQSKIFLYNNCTTATIQYEISGNVFVGLVATKSEERGKRFARLLLEYILKKYPECYNVFLIARENRMSYYEQIGYDEIGRDIILERKITNG